MKNISDRVQALTVLAIWLLIMAGSYFEFGLGWGMVIGLWPGSLLPFFLLIILDYNTYRDYYSGRIEIWGLT